MFMSPTLTETSFGCTGRAGNRSALSWHTATTLLSVVSGSCGIPVNMIPASGKDSLLGTGKGATLTACPLQAVPTHALNQQEHHT